MRGYKYILFILALIASVNMQGQYNPTNPAEPGVYYTLTLQATPSNGGSFNIGTTTTYSEGTTVNLRAYTNSNFQFTAWEQDGEVISTSSSFTYTMPAKNVKLIAHYKYNPNSPSEPAEPDIPVYSTLYLSASPSSGGYFNINSGNKYEVGAAVTLRAYNNSNFSFKNWTENGEVISTSSSFQYVVKAGNPTLVANFTYNPGNPGEPNEAQLYRKLYLNCNPSGGGYFNVSSGNEYQENTTVYLRAYANQWYTFVNWTMGDSIISTSSSFNFVMPEKDVTLTANYTYNYNPNNPNEPDKPSMDQVNIYGMTENGVRGQTIIYPIYLENASDVVGMVVDVQFPQGFLAQTGSISLSGRASGHEMEVKDLGDNNYRFSLLGEDAFTGDNGKMFEVPITIPDTASMGYNYPVILSHGVMHGTDGTQTPIAVRNGYIYVEKVSEDGLYAKYSYDKLQGRVKFTNLSSGNAQRYVWDFGDGSTSTEKNPLHTYAKSGYYTVTLTVKGDVDTDVAEQVVLINDENTWRIDGTFYLSDEESGVRYFTSAEALFSFISATPLSGNVKISVMGDHTFSYPLTTTSKQLLQNLQQSLSSGGYTMSLSKNGTGRNPILLFGNQGGTIDKDYVDFFIELGRNMNCEGVDLQLWGISFNPCEIEKLNNQTIHSGEKTSDVDFSSISADLVFTWTLSDSPANVSGFLVTGERTIPAMTIVNEGEGNCELVFNIKGTREGTTFCEFTNTITVTPALVGLFTNLSPSNGFVSESTTVTLTWNSITNAIYDVYLWNAANQRPNTPVAEGTTELRYTTQNFCQNGHTYKWQIVARNESQTLASDTMTFAVRSLPNLHVYALDCSEPTAGGKFTVQWTVRNDGIGSTEDQDWNDYIWIVTDIYGGTQPSGTSTNNAQLLSTVKNVKALESGESYQNSVDITLPERIYGNYYLLVASDMYTVTDIQWSAVGGSVINPYNPKQDGSGYKHLFASTNASYNKVYEQGETTTLSDNFFYKKIEIAVPNIADLQVPSITARVLPNLEPTLGTAVRSEVTVYEGSDYIYDEDSNLIYSWEECLVPSPVTAAGLRFSNGWYSGKKIAVTVTVANNGGEDTKENFNTVLYMSTSPDHDAAPLTAIASKICKKNIKPGESTTQTYAFYLPYDWYGDTYFHAYADINDAVYELANTQNNWGKSDKYDVLLCPGADFVPSNLVVPSSVAASSSLNLSYKVNNQGGGIPYTTQWRDKIYLSKKDSGLDESAILLSTVNQSSGWDPYTIVTPQGVTSIIPPAPEKFHYSGDSYSKSVTVTPQNVAPGTYYMYVKVDADNAVFEYGGEDNNVCMSSAIRITEALQPDLSVELVSISTDTLRTGAEVAFTWKLKNTGTADIQDAKITDVFYATVNQTATGGTEIARVENSVWIAAGQEKTLRANITVPKNSNLDGLRYIYMKTNTNNAVAEASSNNNTSDLLRSWCTYMTEPVVPTVRGANLCISDLSVSANLTPGSSVVLTYIARNNGDADLAGNEVSQEIYLSNDYNFNLNNATKCEITQQSGSVSGLKTNRVANISLTFMVPNLFGGRKYLHVFADRANTLGEKNTNDNHTYTTVIIDGNLPDLAVTAYSLKDSIMTSHDSPLTFTISNMGEWDAGKTTTLVYLSANDRYDYNDTRLASIQTNALATGVSVEQQATINIVDKLVGNWYLLIQTDANDQLSELNKNNNWKAIPITVVQSPLPDLTATSIATDSVLTSGESMKITSVTRNIGKNATRNDKWSDTYYLSSSTVLNTSNAIQLGNKVHVGTLDVEEEYTSVASFNIPSNVQGNYVLFVVTDAADAIVEEDENNNKKGIPVFINGSAETPADLQIASVSAPGTIKAGEDVTITYTIENVGEYTAAANLHDVIYLSKDNHWDLNDEMVGVVSGNVSVDAGNSITRRATGRIINMPEGDYYVIVKTNSTRSVAEQNTDNNVGVMNSSCRLSFNTINLGSSAWVNTSGYYKLNIPNGYEGKTVGFYLEYPISATAGLYAAYEQVPSTAKYSFASSTLDETQQEILIPNVQAGNYYILAQDNAAIVNSTGNVFHLNGSGQQTSNTSMTLTAKDINFGATTLSISEGGNGGWVSTDINGALFDSIMDFRLTMDKEVIPAEAITYNGMTRSRVTFNLNKAEVGSYDVVSELPSGVLATLPQGFKVVPGASVNLGAKIDAPSVVRVGSYAPVSISYANGGNTDCELYDLILVIDNGYLSTTIEGLDQHQSVLHLPIDTESDARGYKLIPPGTQKTINIFMYQIANNSNLTIYMVK